VRFEPETAHNVILLHWLATKLSDSTTTWVLEADTMEYALPPPAKINPSENEPSWTWFAVNNPHPVIVTLVPSAPINGETDDTYVPLHVGI